MTQTIALVLIAFTLGGVIGYLFSAVRRSREHTVTSGELQKRMAELAATERNRQVASVELMQLRERIAVSQASRVAAETQRDELLRQLGDREANKKELEGTYAQLSQNALDLAIERLLTVVKPHLDGNRGEIVSTLEGKKAEIEGLMTPLREMLESYRRELVASEDKRNANYGNVERGLLDLKDTTSKLATALGGPKTRGNWGELALRRCVELAGLSEHCDFDVQKAFRNEDDGLVKPDMIVRLPSDRVIFVDSKFPNDSYRLAMEETDERRQHEALAQHARNLRRAVDELAARKYPTSVTEAIDFTVLFVAGDQLLTAALASDPSLYEVAIGKGVFLASPTLVVPLLRVVAAGWKAEKVEENAHAALELGKKLYDRFVTVFTYFEGVGISLQGAMREYNKAVSSVDKRLAVTAAELQARVGSSKEMPELEQYEATVIESSKLSLARPLFESPQVDLSVFDEDPDEGEAVVR